MAPQKTARPHVQKPLPPEPLLPVRYSPTKPGNISCSPSQDLRRTSSVYSRNPYEWVPDRSSWQSADFADSGFFLQPVAYSASSPALGQHEFEPARDNTSRGNISHHLQHTHDGLPSNLPRPSVLLPPPVPRPSASSSSHLRTVSLEEARENMNAPGKVHMLPEELRARALANTSRSGPDNLIRSATMGIMNPDLRTRDISQPTTLVDQQGRDRLLSVSKETPAQMASPMFFQPYHDLVQQYNAVKVTRHPETNMAPLADQARDASKSKAAQALGLDSIGESRGRPRHRQQSSITRTTRPSLGASSSSSSTTSSSSSARASAERHTSIEYHSFLRDQYHHPSASSTDFQDAFRSSMLPRPLFTNKPPARLPHSRGGKSDRLPSTTGSRVRETTRFDLPPHAPSGTDREHGRSSHRYPHSASPTRTRETAFFSSASSPRRHRPTTSNPIAQGSKLISQLGNLGASVLGHDNNHGSGSRLHQSSTHGHDSSEDASRSAVAPITPPQHRSPTKMLNNAVGSWKASQAGKRRDELKKRIRVMGGKEVPGSGRPSTAEGGFF